VTRTFELLARVFRAFAGVSFAVLIASVLIQVVSRVMLPQSPVWTEELSRFMLLYLTAFGCGVAIRSGELVNVDLVVGSLPPRVRSALEVLVYIACIVFLASLLPGAWEFMKIGEMQTSPALEWRMEYLHAIVLLAPLSLILFSAERVLVALRRLFSE
jgi:TRAP-type transport system small permease protein